jgi:anti-sigma-K factor RskA
MNIVENSELLERLAAAYALGTLRGAARRRFEQLARQHPAIRAAALMWESRVSGLTEIQEEHTPPAAVWTRIDNLVQADIAQDKQSAWASSQPTSRWWQSWRLWQSATFASLFVAVMMFVGLHQQQHPQNTDVVAVLSDNQANAQLLVSWDTSNNALLVQRIGNFRTPSQRDLQLWALPPGQAPVSLGVLAGQGMVRLPLQRERLADTTTLAVSLEPTGGVPSEGGPTGPVLFKGLLIRKDA